MKSRPDSETFPSGRVINALTIDLEDWYQAAHLDRYLGRELWERCPSRLEGATYRLLALLDEARVKATFFVLGWNAERHGNLVREIHRCGHEIGVHGYHHALITHQTPVQFAWEVARCCALVEDLTGRRPAGHRAASFSVVPESIWALEVLCDHGLEYDSSIFPVRHGRSGIPGSPRLPYRIQLQRGAIAELPITPLAWACGAGFIGGTSLRLLPLWLVGLGIRRLNRSGQPAVVCLRPCELDPEQPRLPLPYGLRLQCYGNLQHAEARLRRLLRDFSFASAREVLDRAHPLPTYTLEQIAASRPGDRRGLLSPQRRAV